jgi:hypothetical protein
VPDEGETTMATAKTVADLIAIRTSDFRQAQKNGHAIDDRTIELAAKWVVFTARQLKLTVTIEEATSLLKASI